MESSKTKGESRRKRMSMLMGENRRVSLVVPMLDENDDNEERRRARQAAKEKADRRKSTSQPALRLGQGPATPVRPRRPGDIPGSGKKQLGSRPNTPARAKAPATPAFERTHLDGAQLSNLYSQCISLATADKINQKNTWSLKLIDYIEDVLQGEDESMNFQKASCTLDASVKIYSSRVDSVHKDTFKVLGGLSRSDEPGANGERKKRSALSKRGASTLESKPQSLQVKKIEKEFDVDPLFKKTSNSFDEGGARGLLMNSLTVHNGCNLSFDGDAVEIDIEYEDKEASAKSRTVIELGMDLELTDLAALLTGACKGDVSLLPICPTLGTFKDMRQQLESGKDIADVDDEYDDERKHAEDSDSDVVELDYGDHGDGEMALDQAIQMEEKLFQLSQEPGNDMSMMIADDDDDYGTYDHHSGPVAVCAMAQFQAPATSEAMFFSDEASELAFIDEQAAKNDWAGAAHWKFKYPKKKKESAKRKKKKVFKVDFFSDDAEVTEAMLAPPKRGNNTLSQATLNKADPMKLLLPEDHHYRAKQLQTLFLKPQVRVRLSARGARGVNMPTGTPASVGADDMPAPDFSAPVDIGHAVEIDPLLMDDGDDSDNDNGHFSFAFNNETMMNPGEQDAGAFKLVDAPTKVAKIDIGFAKFAKKVDVRRLKHSIWGEIETMPAVPEKQVPVNKDAEKQEEPDDFNEPKKQPAADIPGSFQTVISGLDKTLPSKALSAVSVPFCFICLLHLANEKELELSAPNNALMESGEGAAADKGYNLGDFQISMKAC